VGQNFRQFPVQTLVPLSGISLSKTYRVMPCESVSTVPRDDVTVFTESADGAGVAGTGTVAAGVANGAGAFCEHPAARRTVHTAMHSTRNERFFIRNHLFCLDMPRCG
jgi:hypothetical protein